MEQRGLVVEVFSLEVVLVSAPREVDRALCLSESDIVPEIVRMSRVRGHGGIPSVLSNSWFHPRTKVTVKDNFSQPLYDLIQQKSGIVPDSSEEEISAAVADRKLAERLCCRIGDPILVRRRIVRNAGKREIEYNVNHYRADRFTYGLTIRKQLS